MTPINTVGNGFFTIGDFTYQQGYCVFKTYIDTGNVTITDRNGETLFSQVPFDNFYDEPNQDDPDNPVPFETFSDFEACVSAYATPPAPSGGGGAPTDPAGGDLQGFYPNPTLNPNASVFTAAKAQKLPTVYVPVDADPTVYNVTATDCVIYVNNYASRSCTIQLPDPTPIDGRIITVKAEAAGSGITVDGTTNIDGRNPFVIDSDNEAITVQAFGGWWRIISAYQSTILT